MWCLWSVCLDAGPGLSIVMPFMANGSLLDYLKKERDTLYLCEMSIDMDGGYEVQWCKRASDVVKYYNVCTLWIQLYVFSKFHMSRNCC